MKILLLLAIIGTFAAIGESQTQEGIYMKNDLPLTLYILIYIYYIFPFITFMFEQDSSVWIADYLLVNLLSMILLMD